MNSALGFRGWDSLHAVRATLVTQDPISASAFDREDDLLVAPHFTRTGIDNPDLPTSGFGIAVVHSEEVTGEQRRFVAPGAGADLHHGIAPLVRIGRQQAQAQILLGRGKFSFDLFELGCRHLSNLRLRLVRGQLAVLLETCLERE